MKRFALGLAALGAAMLFAPGPASAQEPPALAKAQGAEKERLKGLIEEAKKEGGVVFIDALITPKTHDQLAEAFKKHYGLPASFKVGNTYMAPSGIITRLVQELRSGRVTFDVGAVASPAWVQARAAEGHIAKYESPEYAHYKEAIAQQMGVKDMFVMNAGYTFTVVWNSETTKFEGNSWKDMLKIVGTVPEGRVSTSDSAVTDSTLMVYIGQRKYLSVDDFKQLASLKPVFSYKSENALSRLVSGEDIFALYGSAQRYRQFNDKGAKLKAMVPKEGYVVLPQMMWVFAKAPHPAAARLWFDFMLSQQGQEIFVKNEYTYSARTGFKSPIPGHGLDEAKAVPMDWLKYTEDDLQKARDEWSAIFKPGAKK
ncbi:MAG TPA: ABC transporter substrate-binding protein [Xanthobacteraceae bacterium]|nr:ABC transporter substrate-binding protein [Xanthobacteraceae bacterium]